MDQRFFQRGFRRGRIAPVGQSPAQKLPAGAVNDQGDMAPSVLPTPDAGSIRCPALIGRLGNGRQGFHSGPVALGALAHLPALELADALYHLAIPAQHDSDSPVAIGRKPLYDRLHLIGLGTLYTRQPRPGAVVVASAANTQPATELGDGHLNTFCFQFRLHRLYK